MYGGDIVNFDGSSGESIYGMIFKDENFTVSHDAPYLLSMVHFNGVDDTNNSQFMITLNDMTWLDDSQQVFGIIKNNTYIIDQIENECGNPDPQG